MFHDTFFNGNNLKIFLFLRFHLIPSDPFIWPIVQCIVGGGKKPGLRSARSITYNVPVQSGTLNLYFKPKD